MKEAITDKYGKEIAPGTHIDGRVPINGIFVTCAVNIKKEVTPDLIKEYKVNERTTDVC